MARVLHALSQRPSRTGSGITLDSQVRFAAASGWSQKVIAGVPASDPTPDVGGLDPSRIDTLLFDSPDLPFAIPGMSDVMPYRSTVFSTMSAAQLRSYRRAWRTHLSAVIAKFKPDLIHSHHLWIMSSLVKEVAPQIPVVAQCHATGLRQMQLCPDLAPEVCRGLARIDAFVVLHRDHAQDLDSILGVGSERIHIVGAGYRDDLFHCRGREPEKSPTVLYIGKYSAAKGLPQLLDAHQRLQAEIPDLRLEIVGSGSGREAAILGDRMRGLHGVHLHGQLNQDRLAELARRSWLVVLPSFYEGVPLVLVEALACGCRLIATQLPGITSELQPHLGDYLQTIKLPRLDGVDTPASHDLPDFVDALVNAMRHDLERGPLGPSGATINLERFTWRRVFGRVEKVWKDQLAARAHRARS